MSEYRTGDPVCTCRDSVTAGKAPCPIHEPPVESKEQEAETVDSLLRKHRNKMYNEYGSRSVAWRDALQLRDEVRSLAPTEPVEGERKEGWATTYRAGDAIYFKPGDREPKSKAGTVHPATLMIRERKGGDG